MVKDARCLLRIISEAGHHHEGAGGQTGEGTELAAGDSEEYKVDAIWDSAVYASKSKSGQLPGLYYLVAWKRYPEE